MKYTSRMLLGVLSLAAISQIIPTVPVVADTWTGNGAGGGSWASSEDGATDVSTTVLSSYTVQIPATLDLPTTDTYTTQTDNVEVLAGAHIPSNESIIVKLGANQTFSAANGSDDTVSYKVKLANGTKLANTTNAYNVLEVSAADAHQSGATSSINVGFDTTPDFKYSGTYTGYVQFEVSTQGPVVLNGDGTVSFAGSTWRILVDGNVDALERTHAGDYLVVRETVLSEQEAQTGTADSAATVSFEYDAAHGDGDWNYFNAAGANGYQRSKLKDAIDAYAGTILSNATLAKGVLPVSLNDMNFSTFFDPTLFEDPDNFSGPLGWGMQSGASADLRGATTVGDFGSFKQAFALSYGDLHTIDDVGAAGLGTAKMAFDDGIQTWLRSPGPLCTRAGYILGSGAFGDFNNSAVNGTNAVRPAFWLTTN